MTIPRHSHYWRSYLRSSLALLTLFGVLACAHDPRPDLEQPRLVILFAPCTLNKSYLSPYRDTVAYTPHLDRFSREGYTFTKHRTEAGLSAVAYASLFSGAQAPTHGIFTHPLQLFDSVDLISEAFAANGYEPYYWNDHGMDPPAYGYAQGVPPANVIPGILERDHPRFSEILGKLRTDPDYKAFVMTSFTVTHFPYADRREGLCAKYPSDCVALADLSEEDIAHYREQFRANHKRFKTDLPGAARRLGWLDDDIDALIRVLEVLYRSNVEHLDEVFGGVLSQLKEDGVEDEVLVAFTADHGEALYDPFNELRWAHGGPNLTEVLDIPWILWGPGLGLPAGRAEFVTRSMDVFPTLAGLADVEFPNGRRPPGVDLSEVVLGRARPPKLSAFSHGTVIRKEHLERHGENLGFFNKYFTGDLAEETWVALREEDMVLHYRKVGDGEWRFLAYDLADDPTEDQDIFDPTDDRFRALATKLTRYKTDFVEAHARWQALRGEPSGLSEDDIRRLRSLGYIQ